MAKLSVNQIGLHLDEHNRLEHELTGDENNRESWEEFQAEQNYEDWKREEEWDELFDDYDYESQRPLDFDDIFDGAW